MKIKKGDLVIETDQLSEAIAIIGAMEKEPTVLVTEKKERARWSNTDRDTMRMIIKQGGKPSKNNGYFMGMFKGRTDKAIVTFYWRIKQEVESAEVPGLN